ncbi:MAG: LAGLIDADG family homing endonuclease [Nanoarchaeota archaeon]|nr:LAGLIDADG family homing endonuclease [Nanoarchaeota archaeon]
MKKQSKNLRNFSLQDFKKRGLLPLLAYETGVHLGDGCLSKGETGKYCFQLTGDAVNESEYYSFILKLLEYLYCEKKILRFVEKDNTCVIRIAKRDFCSFKVDIGLHVGKKVNVLIPPFINTKELKTHFLRGFIDTDFCLRFRTLKKSDYPIISTSLSDKKMVEQLAIICSEIGLCPYTRYDVIKKDNRLKKGYSIGHELYLYGRKNLELFVKKVGFWSSKHFTKYLLWKNIGKVPKKSTIAQRYEILKRLGIDVSINAQVAQPAGAQV